MSPKHKTHKKTIPRHIIKKLLKTIGKEKILKAATEKGHTTDRETRYGEPDFSSEAMQASQKTRSTVFKTPKGKIVSLELSIH